MKKYKFNNERFYTRTGFAHVSELINNETGETIAKHKAKYINRTWERYPFQSAMRSAVEKAIKGAKDPQVTAELQELYNTL